MKQNFLYILGIVATLLVVSCTQEDLQKTDAEEFSNLVISVTDGGFIPKETTSDVPTRASENDFRTEFTAGDACGLYIVRDGKIIAENIKLTAAGTGSNVTWNTDAGVELFGGLVDEDYYLYYPYQESMDGKISPAATTDAEFFAPLIKDWQPQADQSDYESGYAASDLMTAEGIITENGDGTLSLSFSMTHRMAMAVVQMPEVEYVFTNTLTTGYKIPNYKEFPYAEFSGNVKPYGLNNGMYRYIFNPQQTGTVINGHYKIGDYRSFTVDIDNIKAGKYKTFYVESSSLKTIEYRLKVGDFFCKNPDTGNFYIIPKHLKPNESDFVGVVFFTAHGYQDYSDYSNSGIGKAQCNGYVMAVKNLERKTWRQNEDNIVTSYDTKKWDGYSNQQILNNYLDNYPAAKFCLEYSPTAPKNTSNWFLPSISHLNYVLNNYIEVKTSVEYFNKNLLGPMYCSSTTSDLGDDMVQISVYDKTDSVYETWSGDKYASNMVLPILAF